MPEDSFTPSIAGWAVGAEGSSPERLTRSAWPISRPAPCLTSFGCSDAGVSCQARLHSLYRRVGGRCGRNSPERLTRSAWPFCDPRQFHVCWRSTPAYRAGDEGLALGAEQPALGRRTDREPSTLSANVQPPAARARSVSSRSVRSARAARPDSPPMPASSCGAREGARCGYKPYHLGRARHGLIDVQYSRDGHATPRPKPSSP